MGLQTCNGSIAHPTQHDGEKTMAAGRECHHVLLWHRAAWASVLQPVLPTLHPHCLAAMPYHRDPSVQPTYAPPPPPTHTHAPTRSVLVGHMDTKPRLPHSTPSLAHCTLTIPVDVIHPKDELDFLLVRGPVTESCQEAGKVHKVDRFKQPNLQQRTTLMVYSSLTAALTQRL